MRYRRIEPNGSATPGTFAPARIAQEPIQRRRRTGVGVVGETVRSATTRSALESLDQLGQVLRLVGEIGLKCYQRVTSRISRARRHRAT
jgi:hypothetical protein